MMIIRRRCSIATATTIICRERDSCAGIMFPTQYVPVDMQLLRQEKWIGMYIITKGNIPYLWTWDNEWY